MPADDRLSSALRITCAGQVPARPCLSKRSAPEDLAERGSDDGAFAACQADRGATLGQLLQPLAPSLVAARRALLARAD